MSLKPFQSPSILHIDLPRFGWFKCETQLHFKRVPCSICPFRYSYFCINCLPFIVFFGEIKPPYFYSFYSFMFYLFIYSLILTGTGTGTGTGWAMSKCNCINNTDPAAAGNCNITTGECLKCL